MITYLLIASFLFALSGSVIYAREVLRGNARPNLVSWSLWATIPFIGFFAQIDSGVGLESGMTFVAGFGPLYIVIITLVAQKNFLWKITKLDYLCGAISIFAVILWLITKNAAVALALSITADAFAGIPTLRKAYTHPESEHHSNYRNSAIASLITLATVEKFTFINIGFVVYLIIMCSTIYILIRFKLGQKLYLSSKS